MLRPYDIWIEGESKDNTMILWAESPQLAEEEARRLFNWDNRPDCKDKKCKATERVRL
jgi:hypothetical protein